MNDKELADKIVALGVGWCEEGWTKWQVPTRKDSPEEYMTEDLFVRDWRVAGALMEKVRKVSVEAWCKLLKRLMHEFDNCELPRAIVESCVEALGDKDDG